MVKKSKKQKLKRNPYVVNYGWHLTSKKYLDNILSKGFKRKIYHQKDNYERWALNNILYDGKSPIYFFTSPNINDLMSPELKYNFNDLEDLVMLKVNVEKFNQLPDITHFLDNENFLLEIPPGKTSGGDINKAYIISERLNSYSKEYKIFAKYFYIRYQNRIPIKKFIEDEELMTDIIFFTETFCITENISPKYIEELIEI